VSGPKDPDRDFTTIGNQQTGDAPHWGFSSSRQASVTGCEF
jgi:hypothetical protein